MSAADLVVEIVITNHNYGEYLGEALESALSQTCAGCLVTVVDDGSTDQSRTILDEYASRTHVIRKEQGGQASAVNAAWAHARGDVIMYLDADDILDDNIAERVARAFAERLDLAKIQFRLEYIAASGTRTGRFVPRPGHELPNGDMRTAVLRFGDDLPSAPMSGNAFARSVLENILPIPESDYPTIGADVYLLNLAALYGPVLSLEQPGGRYRMHGRNAYFHAWPDVERLDTMIALTQRTHACLERHARAIGLELPARGVGEDSLTFAANLMVRHCLDPKRGMLPSRTTLLLATRGIGAALRRRDRSRYVRALYAMWFLATGISPRPLARLIAVRSYTRMRRT